MCARSMWQRAGAVRLFVEHVALFDEHDSGLKSESVVRLWKVQSALSSFVLGRQLKCHFVQPQFLKEFEKL